jgi:hypothetical protein
MPVAGVSTNDRRVLCQRLALDSNWHRPTHTKSCFKRGSEECRYAIPSIPQNETAVELGMHSPQHPTPSFRTFAVALLVIRFSFVLCVFTVWGSDGIEKLAIVLKRRPPFVYATEANEHLTWVMRCNNYVQIVRDCRVAYYLGILLPLPLHAPHLCRWLLTISLPASLPVCLSACPHVCLPLCLKVHTPLSRRRIMPRACKHVCSLSTKLCSGIRHL